MVSDTLANEFDRRKTLETRGATLLTASASLVTLIFGLSVLVTGKDLVFTNRCAVFTLLAALVAFLISAVIAIVVQTHGFKYKVAECDFLTKLAGTNEAWAQWADYAVRVDVGQKVRTICSLRDGNAKMAKGITWSLGFQLAAIALLSVSVGLDLNARL